MDTTREDHTHTCGSGCSHTKIRHGTHKDFLNDGDVHAIHESHIDEGVLVFSDQNPAVGRETSYDCARNEKCCVGGMD